MATRREGRLSHTKYILYNSAEKVTITRRYHPLAGQQFDVLQSGRQCITIQLKDGTTMKIPRNWTDEDGTTLLSISESNGYFSVDSLKRLMALVDAFLKR